MGVENKILVKSILLRTLKAGIKAFLIYVAYVIFLLLTKPIYNFIGRYSQVIDVFFITILIFTFVSELSSGTIYQYMFSFSRELFIIFYFINVLNGGAIRMNVENVEFSVNLQFFILVLILMGVLGMARNTLGAINFLNEKSEEEIVKDYS
ncbi:hypothetical protein J7K06_06575 [Candidatus Bathyarchaeota archaeon]|nr:hypothetical protein [Candidatus Bathyarchaeota archaeon]